MMNFANSSCGQTNKGIVMADTEKETFNDKLETLEKIRQRLAYENRRYNQTTESNDIFRDLLRQLEKAQEEVDNYYLQRIRQVA